MVIESSEPCGGRLTVEDELARLVRSMASTRDAHLALCHWGWAGGAAITFGALGLESGLTRQRVQQIVDSIAQTIKGRTDPKTPILDEAIQLLKGRLPLTSAMAPLALLEACLSRSAILPSALIEACELLGRPTPFRASTIRGVEVLLAADSGPDARSMSGHGPSAIDAALGCAEASIRRVGAARVSQVLVEIEGGGHCLSADRLSEYLSARQDFAWLGKGKDWFCLGAVRRNPVLSRVRKVVSVGRTVSLVELDEGIRRDRRMSDYNLPQEILGDLCRSHGLEVRTEGLARVSSNPPLDPDRELRGSELIMFRILQQQGGPRDSLDLQTRCEHAGVGKRRFYDCLGSSPIFREVERRRFALRGLEPDIVQRTVNARPGASGCHVPGK